MAISPPGDIVLDVARAVDPADLETARTRLRTLATGAATAAFEVSSEQPRPRAANVVQKPDPMVQFEAVVLQTFLQSMLPEDTDSVYGGGVSGDMWKSMLAEQLGGVLARRGGIGIADRFLRDHYVEGETKVPLSGVSSDPDRADRQTRQVLSAGLVQEIQRRVAESLGDDGRAATGVTTTR